MLDLVISWGFAAILVSIATVFLVCAFGIVMDTLKEHHLLDDHDRWYGGKK